ncbi:hypothetical protein [Halonotius sp. GCM10025705]|uniref:hypothetical protein n=1 Tax=Halonotius sp. GCM10025705 TaxID=3252678 RepID=UPI0036213CD3
MREIRLGSIECGEVDPIRPRTWWVLLVSGQRVSVTGRCRPHSDEQPDTDNDDNGETE